MSERELPGYPLVSSDVWYVHWSGLGSPSSPEDKCPVSPRTVRPGGPRVVPSTVEGTWCNKVYAPL